VNLFHGPGDTIAKYTNARLRRSLAVWTFILVVIAGVLSYPYRDSVAVLWMLSVGALILACVAMAFAETPVETEDDADA
jgi:hypothetical protein